jgi:hypothetical protein
MSRREPLLLSDVIDMNSQTLKDLTMPVYYNGVRVTGQPEWNGMDMLTFKLENGQTADIAIGSDTEETGDGDEVIHNMEIGLPIQGYVDMPNMPSMPMGMGGRSRKSRRSRKSKKSRKSRKSRKSKKSRKSRKSRRH